MGYLWINLLLLVLRPSYAFKVISPVRSSPRILRSSVTETPQTKEQDLKDSDKFNWTKHWYPVASLKDTDNERSHLIQLLGRSLVLWYDHKAGRWTTFDDRCPHRAVPLSEGRVEKDGTLMCAYHGWRFDGKGNCVTIPQSEKDDEQVAIRARKACAEMFPTQVAQDMIWVWGESGDDARLESALTGPALDDDLGNAELINSGMVKPLHVGHRDVPYSWESFMENVLDASHVPVSHHGIAGNRDDAQPIRLEPLEPLTKDGFSFVNYSPPDKNVVTSYVEFIPPTLTKLTAEMNNGGKFKLLLYSTPWRPGFCRQIGRQVLVAGPDGSFDGASPRISRMIPAWLQHVLGNLFLHQDLVFLHHQEKILAEQETKGNNYFSSTYIPTAADRAVVAMRTWLRKYAGGGAPYDKSCDQSMPPREWNRRQLCEVYQYHTKDCKNCLAALRRVKKGLKATKAVAIASLAWAVLRGARSVGMSSGAAVLSVPTLKAMIPGLGIMATSLGANKVLSGLHGLFYSYEFHHQDSS